MSDDYAGYEVIECENGFMVLEGNSLSNPYPSYIMIMRKRWVAYTEQELGELVARLMAGTKPDKGE